MALFNCHECNNKISTEASTCPHCGVVPKPPQAEEQTETTILQIDGVQVTTTRVIINNTTYALRNITSVRKETISPNYGCALILAIFGGVAILSAIFGNSTPNEDKGGAVVLAITMIAGGVLWARSMKTKYHLAISTSAGEQRALTSENAEFIGQVVDSVNEAIVRYR